MMQVAGANLEHKPVIAGFTLEPVGHADNSQACQVCMCYLVHRRFCELPPLDLPVDAQWSYRQWWIGE